MTASALGFAAGALAAVAVAQLALAAIPVVRSRAPRAVGTAVLLADAIVRAGREGRAPGTAERRRLLAAGAGVAFCVGSIVLGPVGGFALATAGPWAVSRALSARRDHYRRAVDSGAAAVALAIADALWAGHSIRGAIMEAASGVDGQAGCELRRTAAELAAGVDTDAALQGLRTRAQSPRIETVAAACSVQGSAGGDLARLLRECAEAFGDQARLEDEVRAATAQARFTGVIVVLLPLGGALLAELASPGFTAGLLGSLLTAWLVGLAIAMQVAAALLIRRLGRVRW